MKRRVSGWSFRLMKEGERSESALFVTLTYDTEHVPITKKGYMNLSKTDLQKFFKRLRKLNDGKIKYYAVGEYGTGKYRPHYHIILFNANIETIERAWALDNKKIGEIHVGQVTEASIGYTLKYVSKPKRIPLHANDDRLKEFALMSKGMGKNYLTENMVKWHKNDVINRMYVPIKDGKKISMPRYYKEKIYTIQEKKSISTMMQAIAQKQEQEEIIQHGNNLEQVKLDRVLAAYKKMYKENKNREL